MIPLTQLFIEATGDGLRIVTLILGIVVLILFVGDGPDDTKNP